MTRNWSSYQQDIFKFIEAGRGNAVIEAVAGSGKSTTIVEGMNRLPEGATSLFLAFNKAIADELKERGVNARTFHSLTYSPVTRHKNARSVETNKLRLLCKQNMSGNDEMMYGAFAQKMVGLAKQAGIGCLVSDVESEWVGLADHHDIEIENEQADFNRGIELSRDLLRWSNESNMIDFDDMLYLAVKDGLSLPRFDFVFVDEAQDTNAIQRALLRKIVKPTSRIIAVGDPAQAIYGFRGADSNSLDLLAKEFHCEHLPLAVSYRCPTSVVTYARQWVSHIEAAEGAPAGEVLDLGVAWDHKTFKAEDLVVCRTTRPLIALGYKLLKNRVPVRIMGREIGQGLKALISKMNAKGIDALVLKLQAWADRETEKAIARQQDDKVQSIADKAEAILCIIDGLTETNRTIPALNDVIDTLFADKANAVVLATIHKAKGLEANKVFWLNRSACPSKWAKQAWQVQQEENLCYVAVTRAKQTLVIIEEPKH